MATVHASPEKPALVIFPHGTHHSLDMNSSRDMVMLADVCGLFGLVCFAVLLTSVLLYLLLVLWRYRVHRTLFPLRKPGGQGAATTALLADDSAYGVDEWDGSGGDTTESSSRAFPSLDHRVTHLAVIMDGNRRYGKRVPQQSHTAASEERCADAIDRLCQELCFDGGTLAAEGAASPSNHSWLSERYQYFVSLLQSAKLDGHRHGGEKLMEFIQYSIDAGIAMLTVYAFSTDNWRRPRHEVDALMTLFFFFFDRIRQTARQDGMFIRFISTNPELLPPRILRLMEVIETESRLWTPRRITVNVCVSYGGKEEVLAACNRIVSIRCNAAFPSQQRGQVTQQELDEEMLRSVTQHAHEEEDRCSVFTPSVPRDPQLILRTSGEQRMSNFLLYESAYAEFVFVGKTWPEITKQDLLDALAQYAKRERRAGK